MITEGAVLSTRGTRIYIFAWAYWSAHIYTDGFEKISININTYGTSKLDLSDEEIAVKSSKLFDLRPYAIEQRLKLRNPIYFETSSYGHIVMNVSEMVKSWKWLIDKTTKVTRSGNPISGSEIVAILHWERQSNIL